MERVVFSLNGTPIAVADLLLGATVLALLLLVYMAWSLRSRTRMDGGEALASLEALLHPLVSAEYLR